MSYSSGELTRTDQTATKGEALSSQNALPLVALLPVRSKQVADFATTNTNISSGHVGLGTNVLAQSSHEGITESSNLCFTLALGVKVGSSFAAANVH